MNRKSSAPEVRSILLAWLAHHLQSLQFSLKKLRESWLTSLMTVAVIAITLTLPGGFYVLLNNLQNMTADLRDSASLSLYLSPKLSLSEAQNVYQSMQDWPELQSTRFIDKDQAFSEFRQSSGFGESLDGLSSNPLPHVVQIQPALSQQDPLKIKLLQQKLEALPGAELARMDSDWLEKLFTILELAQRGVILVSLLFSVAVLLIIGNTIRLDIQNRYQEIIVTKLIGATNPFIQRPFLYGGFWFGFLGGLLCWIILEISVLALSAPLQRLNLLYNTQIDLQTLNSADLLFLIVMSSALGWLGSWIAVSRHLKQIEPH